MYCGGKFTDKAIYRSAWNNFVHLVYKHKKAEFKGLKAIGAKWREEKLIDTVRTFDEIFNKVEAKIEEEIEEEKTMPDEERIKRENERAELLNQCLIPINAMNDFIFNYDRRKKYNKEDYENLVNSVRAYSFYPTPQEYAEKIFKLEKSDNTTNILDICAGTGSLSMPFIKSGKYEKIYMVELDSNLSKYLECFHTFDPNIIVIQKNIFDIKSDAFRGLDLILMNPPFEKKLYLKFLLKAYDILCCTERKNNLIYAICPDTAYSENLENFVFPESIVKEIYSDPNIVNKELFINKFSIYENKKKHNKKKKKKIDENYNSEEEEEYKTKEKNKIKESIDLESEKEEEKEGEIKYQIEFNTDSIFSQVVDLGEVLGFKKLTRKGDFVDLQIIPHLYIMR